MKEEVQIINSNKVNSCYIQEDNLPWPFHPGDIFTPRRVTPLKPYQPWNDLNSIDSILAIPKTDHFRKVRNSTGKDIFLVPMVGFSLKDIVVEVIGSTLVVLGTNSENYWNNTLRVEIPLGNELKVTKGEYVNGLLHIFTEKHNKSTKVKIEQK